jgi:hypothetical protein
LRCSRIDPRHLATLDFSFSISRLLHGDEVVFGKQLSEPPRGRRERCWRRLRWGWAARLAVAVRMGGARSTTRCCVGRCGSVEAAACPAGENPIRRASGRGPAVEVEGKPHRRPPRAALQRAGRMLARVDGRAGDQAGRQDRYRHPARRDQSDSLAPSSGGSRAAACGQGGGSCGGLLGNPFNQG